MAAIAQLGERQTEDLEVPSSILGHGILYSICRSRWLRGDHNAVPEQLDLEAMAWTSTRDLPLDI